MKKELEDKFFKRFDFFKPEKPITQSLMSFGFECISKGSKILMEDFSQKNIEEIEIGDRIIGINKEGEKKHYKIVTGVVQNKVNKGIKKCSLLKNDFNSLFLTGDHEVLCFSYDDYFKWKSANSINKNHKPIFFNIKEKDKEFNKGWVIGLLESNGYIINKSDSIKYIEIKLNDKTLMNQYVDALKKYYEISIKEIKETPYIKNSPNSYILEKYPDSHEKKLFITTIYKNKDVKVILNNKTLKNKTHSFLRGWLAGFIDGNGIIHKNRIDIFQKNKVELLEYVLEQLDINYSKKLYKNCDNVFIYHIYTAFETMINCCNYKMKKQWTNTSLRKQPRYDSKIVDTTEEKEVYDLTTTCSSFIANGFVVHNCGDGWFDLIWNLCEQIEKIIPENFEVIQVKEKFGTLRFYADNNTKEIDKLIMEAEEKSAITCEVCGKPGKLRREGWLSVKCEEHK